jgi:hypothetical protein
MPVIIVIPHRESRAGPAARDDPLIGAAATSAMLCR